MRSLLSRAAVCSSLLMLWIQPARAQEPQSASREEQLEDVVRDLRREVDELKRRLNELEGGAASEETQQRITDLQHSVDEIKNAQPTKEEMQSLKKWASDSLTMRPYWKDGLRFDSNDESVKLRIGGRLHADWAFFAEDGDQERRNGADFEDGVEFRRARIYFQGEVRDDIEFKTQYDFGAGDSAFKDVYVGFKNVKHVGNLRIGQFKEPFSLEELTSSNYITFMERSLANTFAPSRNVGIMAHDTFFSDRMTGAVGLFRPTDNFGKGAGDHQYSVTARVTALPWYEDDGKRLAHLGLAYSYQEYEDPIRFRARPEAHLAPRLADTHDFRADHGHLLGLEAAIVDGPFSLQAEYIKPMINGEGARVGNPDFCGAYVEASYFLTGEHRPYKKSSGAFDRVKPLHNFREDDGWGAWELAARYSYIDLQDGRIRGGRMRDVTLGLNWYLNPSTRVMWNYVYSDPSVGGDVSIFQTRVQFAF